MGNKTAIEWTDATWNPIGGCSIESPGCINCYAQQLCGTRLARHPLYAGTTKIVKGKPVFNGHLTVLPDDHKAWTWPLRWHGPKVPRRGPGARPMVFVGDMSDLFHEDRPDAVIDRVFAVMALSPHIDFQVLTKRSARMREYLTRIDQEPERDTVKRIAAAMPPSPWPPFKEIVFPLPNVWLGVSCERQQEADQRIPDLLATPAAIRFVSAEPLLGAIDLTDIDHLGTLRQQDIHGISAIWKSNGVGRAWLDWVIVGGESGAGARPMHLDWARSIRDQCQIAGVPFFFKQWGRFRPGVWESSISPVEGSILMHSDGRIACNKTEARAISPHHGLLEMIDCGSKKGAGRLLDGRAWSEFPAAAAKALLTDQRSLANP